MNMEREKREWQRSNTDHWFSPHANGSEHISSSITLSAAEAYQQIALHHRRHAVCCQILHSTAGFSLQTRAYGYWNAHLFPSLIANLRPAGPCVHSMFLFHYLVSVCFRPFSFSAICPINGFMAFTSSRSMLMLSKPFKLCFPKVALKRFAPYIRMLLKWLCQIRLAWKPWHI